MTMKRQALAASELILNSKNKVYHLNLASEDIAKDVILVGNPERVEKISSAFSKIEFKTAHREFVTHTGWYNNKRITVISTGIGTDNIDIVLNELDAAVNIDLKSRKEKENKTHLNLFRLGTCGALQEENKIDSLVATSHAIGLDGLMHYYSDTKEINLKEINTAFVKHCNWPNSLASPYTIQSDLVLFNSFKNSTDYSGITVTAPGFYGPQDRKIRLKLKLKDLTNKLSTFHYKDLKIINFEMETSALYGLSALLGHSCLSLSVVVANRLRKEFTKDLNKSESLLIKKFLEIISN